MVSNIHLTKDDSDPFDDSEKYRQLVGRLNYLIVIRSNVVYSVSAASQFMFIPTIKH